MPAPHPVKFREKVVRAFESGLSYEEVAQLHGIGSASVKRWVRLHRKHGSLEPLPQYEGPLPVVSVDQVADVLAASPDATAPEITAALNKGRRADHRVHVSSVKRALYRGGYVIKKNAFVLPSSSGPT